MVVPLEKERLMFSERLRQAAEYAGWDVGRAYVGQLKKEFNVSREAARKWSEGINLPKTARIAQISKALGIRGEWLLTGEGSMAKGGDKELDEIDWLINFSQPGMSEVIAEISQMLAKGELDEGDIKTLISVARRIAARKRKK
jgi:transcriptional regulator with XRE-family HTH domain